MHIVIEMTWPQYLRGECSVDGAVVRVGKGHLREFLLLMLARRGTVVPEVDVIEMLWPNPDDEPLNPKNNIQIRSCRLRRLIGPKIETVWGRGFLMERDA